MSLSLVFAVLGLIAGAAYSLQFHPVWQVLASMAMFAGAAAAGGFLLGLLFGVPRSTANQGLRIAANTNLEQISDWLTKILVGITLTQLGTIREGASALFAAMAPSLGGGAAGAAFAGAIVVYYSVLGFVAGWLFARLRLNIAMSNADAYLELARRADLAGDPETANAAKAAAAASVAGAVGPVAGGEQPDRLAAEFARIREPVGGGTERTDRLQELIRQARQEAKAGGATAADVQSMFRDGSDADRIVALGLMQGDGSLADLATALDAISNPRSSFEQSQGLFLVNLLLSTLAADQQLKLRAILESDDVVRRMEGDPSRTVQAGLIRARLDQMASDRSGAKAPASDGER